MQWTDAYVRANGLRLCYRRAGSGSHLLLLHGVTGNGRGWGLTADRLMLDHDVILLDQRGHGHSDAPPRGYDLDSFAHDAAAVLAGLEAAPATLLGHSLGARVALRLAVLHPELVSCLILEDPPLDAQTALTGTTSVDAATARYAWFAWLHELRTLSRDALVALRRRESPSWTADECVWWAQSIADAAAVLWSPDGLSIEGDWRRELATVRCPTLLIRGESAHGSLIGDEEAHDAGQSIATGQVVQVLGAGHTIHWDRRARFSDVVASFLAASESEGTTKRGEGNV